MLDVDISKIIFGSVISVATKIEKIISGRLEFEAYKNITLVKQQVNSMYLDEE